MAFMNGKPQPQVPAHGIEGAALEAMTRYGWPSNVRELSAAIGGVRLRP